MTYEMTSPTLSWTVRDVMRCYPMSILVFNNLGIDTCCGATATLEAAAQKVGMKPDDLIVALLPCSSDEEEVPHGHDDQASACQMH